MRYITREIIDKIGAGRLRTLNSPTRMGKLAKEVVGVNKYLVTRVNPVDIHSDQLTIQLNELGETIWLVVPNFVSKELPEVEDHLEPA